MARIGLLGVAAVGLVVVLFMGIYVLDAAAEDSRHDVTVENETFQPSAGALESFENSELARADYDETVTVRNESDDSVYDPGGNYTWQSGNGTLRVTSGGELANADNASITYGYFGQKFGQTKITTIFFDAQSFLGPVFAIVAFVVLALVGLAALGRAA